MKIQNRKISGPIFSNTLIVNLIKYSTGLLKSLKHFLFTKIQVFFKILYLLKDNLSRIEIKANLLDNTHYDI